MLAENDERLFFYSPYRFIEGCGRNAIFEQTVRNPILEKIDQGVLDAKEILIEGKFHYVLVETLRWDTEYFGLPVKKVFSVLYSHDNYAVLKSALMQWVSEIGVQENAYYFIDIPSEDLRLIQAFCECGFRLTETRLHYVLSDIGSYAHPVRYRVRTASEADIENLRMVSVQMRNIYDRLHADIAFSTEQADAYVATYIENSIRGFSDLVLVPDEGDGPPDGFHSALFPVDILGRKVARFGITAISALSRKGWLKKLISETIYALMERDAEYILVNTQAPNKLVQHVFEGFGFRLACITHIFAKAINGASKSIVQRVQ